MKEKPNIRDKWLHVRLNKEEYNQLKRSFGRTTEQKLSVYARKILLGKPMIQGTRDRSLEDILAVLVKLRLDLNGIGNNYNQVVHKLHTLDHIHEFKAWINAHEQEQKAMLDHIESIRDYLDKTAVKWLR